MEDLPACAAGLEADPTSRLTSYNISRLLWHAAVSPAYGFAFLRPVGKVAGTEIENGYFLPAMCDVVCNKKGESGCAWKAASGRHGQTTVLFAGHGAGEHGIGVPAGCVPYLNTHGLWRPPSTATSHDLTMIQRAGGLFFAAVRDPCRFSEPKGHQHSTRAAYVDSLPRELHAKLSHVQRDTHAHACSADRLC